MDVLVGLERDERGRLKVLRLCSERLAYVEGEAVSAIIMVIIALGGRG
jgi:hypothetical protein